MPSPAKKRKLDAGNAKGAQPRGLEYFFSKQRENGRAEGVPKAPKEDSGIPGGIVATPQSAAEMSDEEFARKIQAEWDEEQRRSEAQAEATAGVVAESEAKSEDKEPDESVVDEGKPVLPPETAANEPLVAATHVTKNTLSLQSVTTTEDQVAATLPLDESPFVFDPSRYLPALQRQWAAEGGHASYALLIRCFVLVGATQSRIKIVDTLVNALRLLIEGDPGSLRAAVWLATNAIGPPYRPLCELGLGFAAISKALRQACGLDSRRLHALFSKHGDPGDVAYEAKKAQAFTLRRPRPLTIQGVYDALVRVARSQGPGSVEAKQRIVDRLLQAARGGEESRYLVRTLCQHLRIGAVKTTMLIALSRAFLMTRPAGATFSIHEPKALAALPKEQLAAVYGRAEETVKACYARRPDYDELVPGLLELGVLSDGAVGENFDDDDNATNNSSSSSSSNNNNALLRRCSLALHIPLRPMLGAITRDLGEMLTKLQGRAFACEYKYDGQRAQVHCDDRGRVSVFSRHLEAMTDKYPDLVALVPRIRGDGVRSFILEGEVVAVDRETGALKSFQTLTNRARKDVALGSITVDVCLFAFDLMFLNGQPLLDRAFRERRELLRSLFVEIPHHFTWVKSLDATSEDGDTISAFFKSATDNRCEGIMVKILDNLPELAYTGATGEADNGEDLLDAPAPAPATKKKTKKSNGKAGGAQTNGTGRGNGGTGTENNGEKKAGGRRKPLLATYEPDKRLDSWLKVKKDYGSTFDTLDLIPVAAWHGNGRKAKWWSPILMAVRNEETGSLEAVTKCMSGFTDAFYKANRAFYDDGRGEDCEKADATAHNNDDDDDVDDDDANDEGQPARPTNNTRAQRPGFVDYYGPEPDIWFEPQEVWEMAFADITLSPTYRAAIGLVSDERGLSLRFPRFLRKRDDKGIDEASTSEFLAGLYRKQEARAPDRTGPVVLPEVQDDVPEVED
ncbi:DNA ligase [Niveomyces insectorum RCEF 264]|uniref:DNA ligase n=1 Tax=Niveomyces insectorum RCEF 264 TaxID=1081102 RepID=A0A162KAP0_9HYPO|nr:DNA ligase [Niveomyces insectorum RCEF 264]